MMDLSRLYKKCSVSGLIAGAVLFCAGAASGFAYRWVFPPADMLASYPVREKNAGDYAFINPLLTFETPESVGASALRTLKSDVESIAGERIRGHDADQISVYVRALNSGRWISVNPDARYNPASLLKVPRMMAFFKLAESDPAILAKKVQYAGDFDDNKKEHFKPSSAIERGKWYTIEELVRAMLVYSDNNATRLLHENIDRSLLERVYTDLGVDTSGAGVEDDFMTISQYTYFFRVLYNATYLNRIFSEKALDMLSKSDFRHGIEAGIPAAMTAAHKFGERTILSPEGTVVALEMHDCGIVYYPAHPYLLCIMTRGGSFDRLSGIIKDISSAVYKNRDEQYRAR